MARVVGGVGTAHSPQLCIPPDRWRVHGSRYDTAERLAGVPPSARSADDLAGELTDEVVAARYDACQAAMARVEQEVRRMAPTVVVIVGDDERELFRDECLPTVAVYWGDAISDLPPGRERFPETMWSAYPAYHADAPEAYPVGSGLARHLVERLVVDGFDVAQFTQQPPDRSLGHAFTFVRRRILGGDCPPIVPLFVNTYYPPNQPTMGRCVALGRALRTAVEAWPGDDDAAVVLLASGGLSHPIVHEDLDRGVLAALATMDEAYLSSIEPDMLIEGSSEIRNWVVVGAALADHELDIIDYIPAYRSPAGSGCGMAFAAWRPQPEGARP